MKKQYVITICIIILLLGIPILLLAGSLLNKTDSTISIEKAKVDAIKTTGIESINVKASPMTCDDKECWTDVYQDNLIQTQFRTSKDYCSKRNEIDEQCNNRTLEDKSKLICNNDCIEYTDYTGVELINMRDDFVKGRLEQYADSIIDEQSKSANTQIDDGGVLTTK